MYFCIRKKSSWNIKYTFYYPFNVENFYFNKNMENMKNAFKKIETRVFSTSYRSFVPGEYLLVNV